MAILGYKNSTPDTRTFGLAAWLETRGLAGWLDIATDGLDAPARQRIANEIGVHYAEAVAAHLAAGEPELSAQTTALAELGDPQKAGLNFQMSHLTESEAKSLKRMERTATNPFFSFRALTFDVVPLVGFALFFVPAHWNHASSLDSRVFAVLLLVAYMGFRLIPHLLYARTLPRSLFLRELALCYHVTGVAFAFAIALIPYMRDYSIFGAFVSSYLFILYGYKMNPGFRIWKKLRKMGDDRTDLRPWQPTAS